MQEYPLGQQLSLFALGGSFANAGESLAKQNERIRTDRAYKLDKIRRADCEGFYEIPRLLPSQHVPSSLISFNYVNSSIAYASGVHFFIDDYQFERVWNDMETSVKRLKTFNCVLTPDFSLYMDMPLPVMIWNIYRSRACGYYWQQCGLEVIPTLSWADRKTWHFCFEGIAQNSVVAVSTIGVKQKEGSLHVWRAGMSEALARLRPSAVLLYGGDVGFNFGTTPVYHFANHVTDRMSEKEAP
jgi:hypothetical protein